MFITYFGLEYGDDGDDALWFLFGCVCLFAFESRPPPGDILPASAFSECSMVQGGGRWLPSGLVTVKTCSRLTRARYQPHTPYLLIRGAGAHPPPASSPPDAVTAHTLTDFFLSNVCSHLDSGQRPVRPRHIRIMFVNYLCGFVSALDLVVKALCS